jgi:uroporphyrinogen-III synthase
MRSSFLRLLKNKGFKEESMAKVRLYTIGTSTTLESHKSLFRDIIVEALRKEERLVTVRALNRTHNSTKLQQRGIEIGCARLYRIVGF